jgi:hypothetical protein
MRSSTGRRVLSGRGNWPGDATQATRYGNIETVECINIWTDAAPFGLTIFLASAWCSNEDLSPTRAHFTNPNQPNIIRTVTYLT